TIWARPRKWTIDSGCTVLSHWVHFLVPMAHFLKCPPKRPNFAWMGTNHETYLLYRFTLVCQTPAKNFSPMNERSGLPFGIHGCPQAIGQTYPPFLRLGVPFLP